MLKLIKFIFIVVFLFSFVPGCKAAEKVVVKEGLDLSKEAGSSESLPAYDFKLNSLMGEEVSLSHYKDKKVVVLVFWTTWCPYCREALRSLRSDFKSFEDMGVELLAINVGESESRVKKFAQDLNLNFQVLLDQDSSVADHYDLLGVPTYVIINKSGRVVSIGNSFSKDRLRELLTK